jgi:hypothetical protein
MAQFYGDLTGQALKTVTRRGSKVSGIAGHLRGWNIGARIVIVFDKATKKDRVFVYKTSGSNGSKSDQLIADFTE